MLRPIKNEDAKQPKRQNQPVKKRSMVPLANSTPKTTGMKSSAITSRKNDFKDDNIGPDYDSFEEEEFTEPSPKRGPNPGFMSELKSLLAKKNSQSKGDTTMKKPTEAAARWTADELFQKVTQNYHEPPADSPPKHNPFVGTQQPSEIESSPVRRIERTPPPRSPAYSTQSHSQITNPFGKMRTQPRNGGEDTMDEIFNGDYSRELEDNPEQFNNNMDDEDLNATQILTQDFRKQFNLMIEEGGTMFEDDEDDASVVSDVEAVIERRRRRRREEEEEDEEEEEEDADEDAEISASNNRIAAVEKISQSSAMGKDQEETYAALLAAVEEKVAQLRRARSIHMKVALSLFMVEYEDELDDLVVSRMELSFRKGQLLQESQVFIGWWDNERGKIVIEDGKHRYLALLRYIKQIGIEHPEKRVAPSECVVGAEIVVGGKLPCMIRKLSQEGNVKPSVFRRIVQMQFIMSGCDMIDNPAMSMDLRFRTINNDIKGVTSNQHKTGVPIYTIQAACLSEKHLKFFKKNAGLSADKCEIVTHYLRAKEVNPANAWSILESLDGIDDVTTRDEKYANVSELLMHKGYDQEDADAIHDKMYKSPNSYSTVKRLVTGNNRLAKKIIRNVEKFLVNLEKCLPPVAFLYPVISIWNDFTKVNECTLYIFDEETFLKESTLADMLTIIHKQPQRDINILVTGGNATVIKTRIDDALDARRAQQRMNQSFQASPSTSSTQLSSSSQVASSPQVAHSSQVTSSSQVACSSTLSVGVATLSVQSAPYTIQSDDNQVKMSNAISCMIRASDHQLLDQPSLMRFIAKMRIEGTIDRVCLRLLSFNPQLEVSNSDYNSVFVNCSSPAPIAIAAYMSCYRICIMSTLQDSLHDQLRTTQAETDDKWRTWPAYKDMYTVDGKMRLIPGLVKKRNKRNKTQEAIDAGIVAPAVAKKRNKKK